MSWDTDPARSPDDPDPARLPDETHPARLPDETDPARLRDAPEPARLPQDTDPGRLLDDTADGRWFAELVNAGYLTDRAEGGDERAWRVLGWRREPAGGWSVPVPVAEAEPAVVQHSQFAERYDAIVIGSGAGGGTAAALLAESGRRVLVVEAGGWPPIGDLDAGLLRNPRMEWGLPLLTRSRDARDVRLREDRSGGRKAVAPFESGWLPNASTGGGGTRVYGAQAWRFAPEDFRMASTYGVPDGSALADWPIGYDDLEPYYGRAEWELGVAGEDRLSRHDGVRSRNYPMPPLTPGPTTALLAEAARKAGIGTRAVPLLINSQPYLGRPGCDRCRACVGFACPVDAKNGSQNTMLPRAFATGRCRIALHTRAVRLEVDRRGRVVGVRLAGSLEGRTWQQVVPADQVLLAAGAVETARLLLLSAHDGEPDGVGNNTDQVGRHLQGHLYGGAFAVFDDQVDDLLGPGPSIATTDFRHGNDGIIGGGMLANEFTLTPVNVYRHLVDTGLAPRWGRGSLEALRHGHRRLLRVTGPFQELTNRESRVRIDPGVRDAFDTPVVVLSGGVHPEDVRGQNFLSDRAAEWLRAAGAEQVINIAGASHSGPSGGQHQAGTCRMGTDPARSVVDPHGVVWGHDNLRVVDGSSHVTNGGVNPVLTIFANAMRITEKLVTG